MTNRFLSALFIFVNIFVLCYCTAEPDDKELLSFSILNTENDIEIDADSNLLIHVYEYVDITNLVPIVIVSPGAVVAPKSGIFVDFSNPVIYTITAKNGSKINFSVTVIKDLNRHGDIISFTLEDTEQILEQGGGTIFIYVPYETDITNIKTNIVVSDMATVIPADGAFVDFTNPQTYTVTSSDGNAREFLVMVKKSPWRKVGDGPFGKRDGAGLVEFKGKMWLIGGWDGVPKYWTGEWWHTELNDVWNTSDGVNWELLSAEDETPWEGRHSAGCVVYKDHIWLISGDGFAEVWKTNDGKNWELVTDNAPWGRRYGPYVTVFNDKLYLIGGVDWWNSNANYVRPEGTKAFNDVWSSTDGENWELELEFAPFAQRGMIHGSVILNDELYIIGGGSRAGFPPYSVFNDVWKTKDGKNWTRVTHNAEWSPRLHHSTIVYDNKVWVVSGTSNNEQLMNDVWYSGNGGVNWKQLKHSFFPETHATSLCVFQGKLWMVSGFIHKQIWVLEDE